ncbi:MAG: NAD-dependent epimerase/dehydratase family protein [Gemmatimonadetes bacterium]|nr:dTDP-glucose 4,6-dehydratase [Gemmatimonadota bacterium]NIR77707.1 dTDP-glucose 4,6-dehydratase [Gemmatimonadota bacterium]NIT86251.1 dTDP-glucose 4,6-dehydratase [Gemmatimonadota bacterium]NIU30079.1 dTDP-glucose 4,6-dehydratase [Gemmatimonadota bacterium]NIU35030.1 NAD-dependent epimerase/dehydratase family protein [Gemmatimonadota bacterium]
MNLLVTGGSGFIGSNLVRHLLRERPDDRVVNLDLLTYAGNPENLRDVEDDSRYRFVHGDICDGDLVRELVAEADAVLHLAAESHVDRSIADDAPFVRTNVVGTQVLLAAAVATELERFLHVSTDEVYGELAWRDPSEEDTASALARFHRGEEDAPGFFTEESPVAPRSPYSATKAASDHLALAYHATHGLDVVVSRCSNNYGPYQYPEKLIPLMITNAMDGKELPVYGDGLNVRDWIHVEDHCRGLLAALERGEAGRVYNFGGEAERTNLDVARRVVELVGAPPELLTLVEDRPGHDRRYAMDISRARAELGWEPERAFGDGLRETVAWYRSREDWWRPLVRDEGP